MKYTPKFAEILDKVDKMSLGRYSKGEIQEFFIESVKNLGTAERMENLYRIRVKERLDDESVSTHIQQFNKNRMQCDIDSKQSNRDLILKMRQGGVTTYSGLVELDKTIWENEFQSAMMAHVQPRVKDILASIKNSYRWFCKDWGELYPTTTNNDNVSQLVIKETNSCLRVCTETKGLPLDRLHISEAAFVPDDRISESCESVPQGGQIIMETTPNIADGFFYDMAMLCINGKHCPYRFHFYPWWWQYPEEKHAHLFVPESDIAYSDKEQILIRQHELTPAQVVWRRMKIAECRGDEGEFCRLYPEDPITCFLSGSKSVFPVDVLSNLFKSCREPSFRGDLISEL
jgi:hypothetical protein